MVNKLENILAQILNSSIKSTDILNTFHTLSDNTKIDTNAHANLITVVIKFINKQRYHQLEALLAKLNVQENEFDNLLTDTTTKEQQGIAVEYQHLRHYVVDNIFKTIATNHYQEDIFAFIISKFKLTGINFLQLLVNIPSSEKKAIEIAARGILGSSTIQIKNIIPYMVEYFSQPTTPNHLEAFLNLLDSLKNIELVNESDLTQLVEAFVLNSEHEHNKMAVRNLSLDSLFVQRFIKLIPCRKADIGTHINSDSRYLHLVEKIIQQLTANPTNQATLSPWVKANLAEFITLLPSDEKNKHLANNAVLTELFGNNTPSSTINTTLDAFFTHSSKQPSEIVSRLASYKLAAQGYLGLQWAINKLPMTEKVGLSLVTEIEGLLKTTLISIPLENIKILYQQLIKRLDDTILAENSDEQRSQLVQIFEALITQAQKYPQYHLLEHISNCGKTTHTLFTEDRILDAWFTALHIQHETAVKEKKTANSRFLYTEMINRLDAALKNDNFSQEQKDHLIIPLTTIFAQISPNDSNVKAKTITTEENLELMQRILDSSKDTVLFSQQQLLSHWLQALLRQNRNEKLNKEQTERLGDLYHSSVKEARKQGVTDQQICKLCVEEFVTQINNRAKIKTETGVQDFSNAAYSVEVFGLLGLVNYIALDRNKQQLKVESTKSKLLPSNLLGTVKSVANNSALGKEKHKNNKKQRMAALAQILAVYATELKTSLQEQKPSNYQKLYEEVSQAAKKFDKKGRSGQFSDTLRQFKIWVQANANNTEAVLNEIKTLFNLLSEMSTSQPAVKIFLEASKKQASLKEFVSINEVAEDSSLQDKQTSNIQDRPISSMPTLFNRPVSIRSSVTSLPPLEQEQEQVQTETNFTFWDGLQPYNPQEFEDEQALIDHLNNFLAIDPEINDNTMIVHPNNPELGIYFGEMLNDFQGYIDDYFQGYAKLREWFINNQARLQELMVTANTETATPSFQ